MLPRSAILYCTHFIEHESVPSNGGTLFQKNSLHDCLCRTYSRSFIYNAGGSQTYALVLLVFEHEVQPYPCRDCFDTLCSQSFMTSYLKHFAAPNKLAPQKSPGQYCCLAEKVFDNGISIQRSMAPFDLGCCLGVISDA